MVEENAPLLVYDTSGPYTDETAAIDVRRGLPPLRAALDRRARRHEEIVGRAYRRDDDGRRTDRARRARRRRGRRAGRAARSAQPR